MTVEQEMQSLRERLRAAERSFQSEVSRSFVYRSVKYVLAILLLLFLLDVIFHFPPKERLLGLAVLGGAVFVVIAIAAYIRHLRARRLEHVARLLETMEPSLGSKMINALQLEEQTRDTSLPELTRELAKGAVNDYERKLRHVDFMAIAHYPRLKFDWKRAGLAVGVFAVIILVTAQMSFSEIARFADPYGDHPAYSFTQLAISQPGEHGAKVIYGKNALIRVNYSGHRPKDVFLTFYDPAHPENRKTVPMFSNGNSGYSQQIENIKTDLIVFAHTRNEHAVSKRRELGVILTPRIEKAFARITPPAYTALPSTEHELKSFRALEGSTIQFRLRSNRPLQDGVIDLRGANHLQAPMARTGENEVSGFIAAKESGRLSFAVTDADKIPSGPGPETLMTVTHDLPPEISIVYPEKDCFVCIDYRVEVEISASDDYGLKTIRIHRALNGTYSPPQVITFQRITRSAKETVAFNLQDLGVEPGDVLSIYAEAIDNSPSTNVARTKVVNMTIISEEDYNNYLREQNDLADAEAKYTDLLNRFQERIDEQKRISEDLSRLQDQLQKSTGQAHEAQERQAEQLVEEQSDLNSDLNDLAEEMENFVRKNPVYDFESSLQDMLSQKAQDIQNSTSDNDKAMSQIGNQQPSPSMLQDFKQAANDQLKRLDKTQQKARSDVQQTFGDLAQMQELLKDFNRFQDLYESQKDVAAQSQAYSSNSTLSREDQVALRGLAPKEKSIEDQLRQLGDKLRNDARSAESKFPKAAESARDLADKIENRRMPPLAKESTDSMLNGDGEQSAQLSERLRSEMENLFQDAQSSSQSQAQSDELDNYLQLQRQMRSGDTLKQMAQSRKFQGGQPSSGSQGEGEGSNGQSGTAQTTAMAGNVLGRESRITESAGASSTGQKQSERAGQNPGTQLEKSDAMAGVKPVRRNSEAVSSEVPIDQYDDLVDKYFKTITK